MSVHKILWSAFFVTIVAFSKMLGVSTLEPAQTEVEFVIVIPSYNNERFCVKNLESVVNQAYPHFKVVYVNDCSSDNTKELVTQFIQERNLTDKVILINNKKRCGALENLYNVIHACQPQKVIVTCDGDDTLASPHVLDRLAQAYADKNVWMTYGDFRTTNPNWSTCCAEVPAHVAISNTFRSNDWVTSHLRTFYAKLFQKIRKKDLLWKGEFFPMTWDMAMMFPMIEMASKGHFRFIKDVLYIYNVENPICDYRVNAELQVELDKHIRSLEPYKPLKKLF